MKVKDLIEFLADCDLDEEVYFVDECADIHRIVSAEYEYPNYVTSHIDDCLLEDGVVDFVVPGMSIADKIAWSDYEHDIDGKIYPLTAMSKQYCRKIPMLSAYDFSILDHDGVHSTNIDLRRLIAHGRSKYQDEPLRYQRQVESELRNAKIKATDPDYQKYLELKEKFGSVNG